MIKIAVVEDDEKYVGIIKEYISRFMKEKGITMETDVFRDGEKIIFQYQPVYDIILMDIEMPKMDGMTAAQKIREMDKDVIIIFITNMAQYAIQGYQVRARSYILKPINYIGFSFELEEAVSTLAKRKEDSFLIQGEDGLSRVQIGEIYYLESQGHRILIHTQAGVLRTRETMKHMEERFQGFHFARCNVSYLVNLAQVSGIDGDSVTVGNAKVPISRQKRKSFLEALTTYIGGGEDA